MVVSVSISVVRVDPGIVQAYVETSRQCRMALPPFAATANGARIRPAPTGHGIERQSSNTTQSVVRQPRASVGVFMNCEPRDLSRRIVLRTL
jgi:hypothetical protein